MNPTKDYIPSNMTDGELLNALEPHVTRQLLDRLYAMREEHDWETQEKLDEAQQDRNSLNAALRKIDALSEAIDEIREAFRSYRPDEDASDAALALDKAISDAERIVSDE